MCHYPSGSLIDSLFQRLREAQAELNRLRSVNASQERQLADKENEQPEKSKPKEGGSPFDPDDLSEIKEVASKFTYMSHMWIRNLGDTLKLKLDPKYKVKERYATMANRAQGICRELCEVIPEKWHGVMGKKHFRSMVSVYIVSFVSIFTSSQFNKEMNQQRSNSSTRIRIAGPSIFNCLPEDFKSAEARKIKFRTLIGWSDAKGQYMTLAPIIYKDYEGEHNCDTMFLNPILLTVQIFFFGLKLELIS